MGGHCRIVPPRRPRRFRWAVLAAPLLAGLAGCGGVRSGDALWFSGSIVTNGQGQVQVNEPVFFGLFPLVTNPGTHPIHLLRAELLGVPAGMVVDHFWAERVSGPGGTGLGTVPGFDTPARERPFLHELTEVTLDPLCGPAAKCHHYRGTDPPAQDWYLAVQAHLSRSGGYGPTTGVRLICEIEGQEYEQTVKVGTELSTGDIGALPNLR